MPGGNLEQKGKLTHTRPTKMLEKEIRGGRNMQEKLLRLLKSLPMILGRISCEAGTEVWVALSHAATEKEATGKIYFLPSQRTTFSIPFLLTRALGTTWVYAGERD